jgi:hypothetical protein
MDATAGDIARDVSFGERQRGFFKDMSGKSSPETHNDLRLWDNAWEQAHEEMMDENHAMLVAICDKLGIKL